MRIAIADIVFITAANASGELSVLPMSVSARKKLLKLAAGKGTKMEVKINREIRNYTESMFFGLTLRQFIFSVLACTVAVGVYFLLKPYVGTETVSWMCILAAAPFAALGFIKYNGMTAEKFVWAWIKSEFLMPKKLVFHSTNTYFELMKPSMLQKSKRYLKSGVMENGVVIETEEGSPQGGNLSPLLANIYLNEFDQEFNRRGVPCIRYADDIVLLAKSERASERLLETSTKYLEGTLKLKVNREKSRTVSVFAIRNFKYLGFCLGKNGKGIHIRVHAKTWKKAKDKLRKLTSRSRCGSIVKTMERIKVYMRGWLNYFSIADMKNNIETLNSWLYRRIRMCIWKQWKLPGTRKRKLIGLGVDSHYAATIAYDRKGYWFNAGNKAVNWALNKERLINWGFYDLTTAYQSMHVNY